MNFFVGFLIVSFISGLVLATLKPRQRAGFILLLCLGISFAYYFLNKI